MGFEKPETVGTAMRVLCQFTTPRFRVVPPPTEAETKAYLRTFCDRPDSAFDSRLQLAIREAIEAGRYEIKVGFVNIYLESRS